MNNPPRHLPAGTLPTTPRGYCKGCSKPGPILIGQGRSSWHLHCLDRYNALRSATGLRRYLRKRDRGVCAVCRLDTYAFNRWLRVWVSGDKAGQEIVRGVLRRSGVKHRSTLWDAAHIVPVFAGGGCAGSTGVVTLCVWCHKKNTTAITRGNAMRIRIGEYALYVGGGGNRFCAVALVGGVAPAVIPDPDYSRSASPGRPETANYPAQPGTAAVRVNASIAAVHAAPGQIPVRYELYAPTPDQLSAMLPKDRAEAMLTGLHWRATDSVAASATHPQ